MSRRRSQENGFDEVAARFEAASLIVTRVLARKEDHRNIHCVSFFKTAQTSYPSITGIMISSRMMSDSLARFCRLQKCSPRPLRTRRRQERISNFGDTWFVIDNQNFRVRVLNIHLLLRDGQRVSLHLSARKLTP